jgi:hypothetical protein
MPAAQFAHVVAAAFEYWPVAQAWHADDADAPDEGDAEPAAQITHSVAPEIAYLPATQVPHAVAPETAWKLPPAQDAHDPTARAENVPAVQGVQAVEVVAAKVPARQLSQVEEAEAAEYLPTGQLVHCAAAVAENLPAAQATQLAESTTSSSDEALPAVQDEHEVAPVEI